MEGRVMVTWITNQTPTIGQHAALNILPGSIRIALGYEKMEEMEITIRTNLLVNFTVLKINLTIEAWFNIKFEILLLI